MIPRRWPVKRTFAWLTAHRRLARDNERHPAYSEAMIRWAAINTMTRRRARGQPSTRQKVLSGWRLGATAHPLARVADHIDDLSFQGFDEHPGWDEYRAAMVADGRLVARLRVDRRYGGPG